MSFDAGKSRTARLLEWFVLVVVVVGTIAVLYWRDTHGPPPRCMTPDVVRIGSDLVREHMVPGAGGEVGPLVASPDGEVDRETGLRHCTGAVRLPHGEERIAYTVEKRDGRGIHVRLRGVMPGCGSERVRGHLERTMTAAWRDAGHGSGLRIRSVEHRAFLPETGERVCVARVAAPDQDWVLEVALSWADAGRTEFRAMWEESRR